LLGKGLYELHPELAHRLPVYRSGGEGGSLLSDNNAYYERNVWVRKAINVIADNLAWLPVGVSRSTDGLTWDNVQNHAAAQLLQYVNDAESSDVLQRAWAVNMLTDGECGWEVVPNREIWTRQSAQFDVRIPKGGRRYMRVSGYKIEDQDGEYFVPREEFVHFKFYNKANPLRGLTPISAIKIGVEIDEFARAWSRSFFKNSARPDYVALAPEGTTVSEREELRDALEGETKGMDNWHRIIVLENRVIDIKPLNLAPKDTDWLEQRKFSREEIGGMFGVPDEIMGFGRDTYENFDTAQYVLWYFTIIPLIRSRDSTLTEFFKRAGVLKPNERITTDLSDVQVLQEDITEKVAQAHVLISDGVPANAAYEKVGLDIDLGPAGDIGYLPISMVPVGSSPYALSSEERAGQPVTKDMKAPEFGSLEHVKLWTRKDARTDPYRAQMKRLLKKNFQRQQTEIGRALRDQKAIGRGKAADVQKSLAEMFNLHAEKERFKVEFLPLLREALKAFALDELQAMGIDIDFDLDRPEVRGELEGILYQFAEKVNDTTYNDLVGLFSEAESQGETIPQIMERLSSFFEGRKSEASCERIARTTMTAANSAGDEAAWIQSGVTKGSIWLTAIDGRERDAHNAAHGQERRLGELFEVGGEMLTGPGDPNGSAGNIINCRCTRKAVLK